MSFFVEWYQRTLIPFEQRWYNDLLQEFNLLTRQVFIPRNKDEKRWWAYTQQRRYEHIVRIIERAMEMAGKSTKKQSSAEWKGFIDCRLTEEQVEGLMMWELSYEDVWVALTGELSGNYRFTLSFNSQNDHFVAALTGGEGSPNQGYTLSSFAPDVDTAVRALCYKHFVVLEQDWQRAKNNPKAAIG